jgi:hypothetical protein
MRVSDRHMALLRKVGFGDGEQISNPSPFMFIYTDKNNYRI